MKIDQPKESVNSEVERQPEPALSRRVMLLRSSGLCSIGLGLALGIAEKNPGERAASVDEIVNSPYEPVLYREVVCTGVVKHTGHVKVTTWTSSSADELGSVEVVSWLPTYTLYGSSSNTELPLLRDCNEFQEMLSSPKTTDLEEQLQNGEEVVVRVRGVLTIRDGEQYLMYRSMKKVLFGFEYPW